MNKKELYIAYLNILQNNINNNQLLALYQKINKFYKQEKKESIEEYNEITIKKLLDYAKEESRYPLINTCLTSISKNLFEFNNENYLDTRDLFLANNLESIYQLLQEDRKTYINQMISTNKEIPTIDSNEYDRIIYNILKEIDPTESWLSYYEELDCTGKIIYLDELSEEEKYRLEKSLDVNINMLKNCCVEFEDIMIFLESKTKLSDIPAFFHEFAHAISFNSKEEIIGKTTSEYPSIFYELYSINYLEKLGYSKEIVHEILNERYNYTIKIGKPFLLILKYLVLYVNQNGINKKNAINLQKEEINKVIKLEQNNPGIINFLIDNDPAFFEPTKKAKFEIDTCIKIIVSSPQTFYENYKYLIGFYLARKALNNEDLNIIKYHTEHLKEIGAFEILEDLNINTKDLNINPRCQQEIIAYLKKLKKEKKEYNE